MNYPLTLSFKILALAPQILVTDAAGQTVFYVRQKLLKLKEAVTVFADPEQQHPLYTIHADRILDFGARYEIADMAGRALGAVQQHGLRTLWSATYDIHDGGPGLRIEEENPWIKVADQLLAEVPVLGLISGYLFHPTYRVVRPDGTVVLRLRKEPALLESRFQIEQLQPLPAADETRALLSVLLMVLLERGRG
jgi:uncharacterized protein YxjI